VSKVGSTTHVKVQGLHIAPPKEGLELYAQALKDAGLEPSKCAGRMKYGDKPFKWLDIEDEDCVQKEIDAAGKFLKKNWKKVVKKSKRKVSTIVGRVYGSNLAYLAIKASEGSKADNFWAKFFYKLCIYAEPITITDLIFENDYMYAKYTSHESSPDFEAYANYHIQEKKAVERAMLYRDLQKNGKSFESITKNYENTGTQSFSSTNVLNLLSYGDPAWHATVDKFGADRSATLDAWKVKQSASPSAVAKLFSFCADSTPEKGPTCKGKTPGRVSWGTAPRAGMM